MSLFKLIPTATPDSSEDYDVAAIDQLAECEYQARRLAFSAIRRAAEVARRHDHKHSEYCAEHGPSWASPGACEASAIRYAIRAAIGSEKAQ